MKKTLLILMLGLTGTWAQATLQPILNYSQTFGGGTIADGNPVGRDFYGNFQNAANWDQVVSLTVGLNISGGYNGDLYAYLVAPNGTLVLLMSQPGGGAASGAGMNITLTDASAPNGSIQSVTSGAVLSGTYNAAGTLGNIGGPQVNPTGSLANGTWLLYFADLAGGGGNETLNNWTLNLAVVPEPVPLALGLFAIMMLALAGVKRFWIVN